MCRPEGHYARIAEVLGRSRVVPRGTIYDPVADREGAIADQLA